MLTLKRKLLTATMGLVLIGGPIGCASNAGNGALIGGATGAGLGAIIGHNSHGRTGSGAAIGGAVGAISGALIGNEMDKQERRDDYYDRDRPVRYYERDEYRSYPPPPPPPPPDGYTEYRETRVYRGY
jgi:uncharacterized protein YcfJ